jgi:glutamyl-tRNA reductase
MLANYKILTVTHKRTNLKEIGDFVLKTADQAELKQRLESLKVQFHLDELFYLQTCNRVMYFFTSPQTMDERFTARFFQSVNPTMPVEVMDEIDDMVYQYEGLQAVEHFLDVASSIDSLVIGERQILRQIREAFEQCREWGLTGDYLRIVFQQAVVAAKAVYNKTRIGDKPISVVSLSVQQMLRSHVHANDRLLIIGAGQTNQLVGKFLVKHGFSNVTVFNRSLDKAEALAKNVGGTALPLSELPNYTGGFDCMIVFTGSTEPIITTDLYRHLLQGETDRKVVIDLAIPNNVDELVTEDFLLEYIEVEGLRNLAKKNLAFREREVERAKRVLNGFLEEVPSLIKQRQIELALRNVPVEIKAVKEKAMNEVFHKELATVDDQTKALMEKMLAYMEKKCIGIPMKAAREAML